MAFENIAGLYLLSFIIALIILYLVKAKPKELTIPSLIFFLNEKKITKYNSILKKFLVRTLFFIQLLIIILLAFSAAGPIISVPIDAYSLNTVVVIDTSASMLTKEGKISRMEEGKERLLEKVKGRVSIILAEEIPTVLASNISSSRAKALLTNLDAKHTKTRLDSSIIFATELLGTEKGNIVVYSDFLLPPDDSTIAAKKLAEGSDKRVFLISTGSAKENLGFIDLNFFRGKAEAFIKNYGKRDAVVDVRFISEENEESTRITVSPGSTEIISFDLAKGATSLDFIQKDRLIIDDKIYLINPYDSVLDILLITNDLDTSLFDALDSNPSVNVEVTIPPVIPDLTANLVIVNNVDVNQLLPNTFREIKDYKDSGGKVIITAQKDLDRFNFQGLVNFNVELINKKDTFVGVDFVNEFTARISNQKVFTDIGEHFVLSNFNDSIVIASTEDGNPIFLLENNLFFYGILDDESSFKEQINYPLFWNDLINFLLERENLANFNFKTGDTYIKGNLSNKIILEKTGIIKLDGKDIAVNLLNSDESNTFRDSLVIENSDFQSTYEKVNLDINIGLLLLILATLMLIFELFYIKRRGDL